MTTKNMHSNFEKLTQSDEFLMVLNTTRTVDLRRRKPEIHRQKPEVDFYLR